MPARQQLHMRLNAVSVTELSILRCEYRIRSKRSCRKCYLKIETAGICVNVDDLSGEIKSRYDARLHTARIYLSYRNTSGGYNCLFYRAGMLDGESKMLKHAEQRLPFFSLLSYLFFVLGNAGQTYDDRYQLTRKQIAERVSHISV